MTASDPTAPAVLHVNTERSWRGGEQQTLYLLNGLRDRGIKSVLVAKQGGVMAERARAAGHEHVYEMPMGGDIDLRVPVRLRKIIKEHGLNLLHAHTSHAHVFIQLAAALCRPRPKVLVHRRVDFSIFRRNKLGLNAIKYRYGVDRYVTVSHAIKAVLENDGISGDKISVVHSGIDFARIEKAPERRAEIRAELGVAEDAPLICNVAWCADHKGQTYLVQAAPAIFEKHPRARIAIVGDGELKGALMEEAAALGVADKVIFAGYRKDVPSVLKAIDIFVMPSHMEGLGTSVIDAMAARLPIVGTRAGGIPELIRDGETGLLCPIRDPESIAEAVIRLLDDPAWAKTLGEAAYKTAAEGFSAEAMVRGNLAVYESLLK